MIIKLLSGNYAYSMKQNQAGDPPAGGGGGNADDMKKEMADLKSQLAELAKALTAKQTPNVTPEDPTLADKARQEREQKEKSSNDHKSIEAAVRFQVESKDWLKNNASLLPKNVSDIFAAAERETYDSPVEKDSAIKSGIVQEFFSLQANVEMLTASQKTKLDEYLKLTAKGKAEKARAMYEDVFEPAFEMLKLHKKAEHLKTGGVDHTDAEKAYKERLLKQSTKHYLGV